MIYIMNKIIILTIFLILIYTIKFQHNENFLQYEFCSDYKKKKIMEMMVVILLKMNYGKKVVGNVRLDLIMI